MELEGYRRWPLRTEEDYGFLCPRSFFFSFRQGFIDIRVFLFYRTVHAPGLIKSSRHRMVEKFFFGGESAVTRGKKVHFLNLGLTWKLTTRRALANIFFFFISIYFSIGMLVKFHSSFLRENRIPNIETD